MTSSLTSARALPWIRATVRVVPTARRSRASPRHKEVSERRASSSSSSLSSQEVQNQKTDDELDANLGVERGVPFTRENAFYRLESAQARDLAVLLASVMSDEASTSSTSAAAVDDAMRKSGGGGGGGGGADGADGDSDGVSVLDAMSGCGVRCARYLLQGDVARVHANDADPLVTATLERNLAIAQREAESESESGEPRSTVPTIIGTSKVTTLDAHRLLARFYLDNERYDIVDVDSFGSENLTAATFRCVKLGGYAYITSTDALALCGKNPGTLTARYGGAVVAPNTQGANEHGLRVFIGGVGVGVGGCRTTTID